MVAAMHYDNQGDQRLAAGDYDAAWTHYLQALVLSEKDSTTDRSRLEKSLGKLDGLLDTVMAANPVAARPFLVKGLSIWQRLRGENHPETAAIWHNLGYLQKKAGSLNKALHSYESALAIWKGTLPADHPHLAACFNNLGTLHKELGNLNRSYAYYQRALLIWQSDPQRYSEEIAIVHNNLGRLFAATGCYWQARTHLLRALPHGQERFPHETNLN